MQIAHATRGRHGRRGGIFSFGHGMAGLGAHIVQVDRIGVEAIVGATPVLLRMPPLTLRGHVDRRSRGAGGIRHGGRFGRCGRDRDGAAFRGRRRGRSVGGRGAAGGRPPGGGPVGGRGRGGVVQAGRLGRRGRGRGGLHHGVFARGLFRRAGRGGAHGQLGAAPAVALLDHVRLQRQGAHDAVQLQEEAARVAQRMAVGVPPPQRRGLGEAVGARRRHPGIPGLRSPRTARARRGPAAARRFRRGAGGRLRPPVHRRRMGQLHGVGGGGGPRDFLPARVHPPARPHVAHGRRGPVRATQAAAMRPLPGRADQLRAADGDLLFRRAPGKAGGRVVERVAPVRLPRHAGAHVQRRLVERGAIRLHHHRPVREAVAAATAPVVLVVVGIRPEREHFLVMVRGGPRGGRGRGVFRMHDLRRVDVRMRVRVRHGVRRRMRVRRGDGPGPGHGAEHGFVVRVVDVLGLHRRGEVGRSMGRVGRHRALLTDIDRMPIPEEMIAVVHGLRGGDGGREVGSGGGVVVGRVQRRAHRGVLLIGGEGCMRPRGRVRR